MPPFPWYTIGLATKIMQWLCVWVCSEMGGSLHNKAASFGVCVTLCFSLSYSASLGRMHLINNTYFAHHVYVVLQHSGSD